MSDYPDVPACPYDELRPRILSGDLLLCSGTALFSRLIQRATGSVWSHVGVLYWAQMLDRLLVLESVESVGVRSVPLRHYLGDYKNNAMRYPGRMFIARHQACTHLTSQQWRQFGQYAVDHLGYAYNGDEITRIATCILAPHLARELPNMDTAQSFICSQYAANCFAAIGITIAMNPRGYIAPADFVADPAVSILWEIV